MNVKSTKNPACNRRELNNKIVDKYKILCRLCLNHEQKIDIFSVYKNYHKYSDIAMSLATITVNLIYLFINF